MSNGSNLIRWFADLSLADVADVGGKNASLGEMLGQLRQTDIPVPDGFATTAKAYWLFIDSNGLREAIGAELSKLDADRSNLADVGVAIRDLILAGTMPAELTQAVTEAYTELARRARKRKVRVAVRSSATAEDLPEASFAGQLESFLNVRDADQLVKACQRCYASLFTDRAMIYRENNGFNHMQVALSVGVQQMVRADKGAAGVMFSIDTDSGFPQVVLIHAVWGLGETLVRGSVDPDEYHVYKPLLEKESLEPIIEKSLGAKHQKMVLRRDPLRPTRVVRTRRRQRREFVLEDQEILQLARWACQLEAHYGRAMDIEWAKDGQTGELYVVQARPETVQSQKTGAIQTTFRILGSGERLVSGHAVGDAIAVGRVRRLDSPDQIGRLSQGDVLVTSLTDPDWVPIMKKAGALVTDHGGRTSHAAIVSRELGLTALVGTENATQVLQDGQLVTVCCAEGDTGFVYADRLDFVAEEVELEQIPATKTRVMVNMGNPAAAYRWWRLPTDGVGLARMEFIIGSLIKIHPMALIRFNQVTDRRARREIKRLTRGFERREDYFVDKLARGIARIAAAHHPNPVIFRCSDFKSNEYARLIGGQSFEPHEENPMLGWRGASRYYSENYRDGFALECRALKQAREVLGFDNLVIMIPFCRTLTEADQVLAELAKHGLVRGRDGLEVYVMAELPANIILASDFAARFDGFSIGSNDLTQLTLGVDRDNELLSDLFDERNPAVTQSIATLLDQARQSGAKTGLCGQAPSDHPEFAEFLVEHGIDSISVVPESFVSVKRHVAAAEAKFQA